MSVFLKAALSPEDRVLRDHYLTDADGKLTGDGRASFLQWLFQANKAEYVTAYVAARKKIAEDQVADRAAISATIE